MNSLRANFNYTDELEFQEEKKVVALNFASDRVSAEPEPRGSREEIEAFVKERKVRTQRQNI